MPAGVVVSLLGTSPAQERFGVQSECNMYHASIQELRSETCHLVLPFLATWPTSNPSSNRGRSSQGYDWSAAHMKLLLYGLESVNISSTVWDDF